jgi:glyoxylase-like metal-dependent hydrolase (beta-lactamase superfamily II)
MNGCLVVRLLCCLVVTCCSPVFAQNREGDVEPLPAVTITSVRGDLYRIDVGGEVTVALVSAKGIVIADPLSRRASRAIGAELASRFPQRPVRYVVLTQHRFDRVEGASQFNKEAEIVAYREFDAATSQARRRLPDFLDNLDSNRNGVLDATEVSGDPRAALIIEHDRNNDGRVTPDELYVFAPRVEQAYSGQRTIVLDGKSVELMHPGPAYGVETTIIYFPAERVVFVGGHPDLSAGFWFGSVQPSVMERWVKTLSDLEFDTLLSADGETHTRAEIVALRQYLDDVRAEVLAGYERGQSIAELQASGVPAAHRASPYYTRRNSHIDDVYRALRPVRVGLQGSAAFAGATGNPAYCAEYTECGWRTLVPAGTAGLTVSLRRLIAVAEVRFEGQSLAARTSAEWDDAFAHRETTANILFGYATPPARRFGYNVLGGLSYVRADSQGLYRVKQFYLPAGGRHPLNVRESRYGFTGGADLVLALGNRLAAVVPLRFTRAVERVDFTWPGRTMFQAGVGLRFVLHRSGS